MEGALGWGVFVDHFYIHGGGIGLGGGCLLITFISMEGALGCGGCMHMCMDACTCECAYVCVHVCV